MGVLNSLNSLFKFSHITEASVPEFVIDEHYYTYPNQQEAPPTISFKHSEALPGDALPIPTTWTGTVLPSRSFVLSLKRTIPKSPSFVQLRPILPNLATPYVITPALSVARSHLHAAMEGYNAVIFAYGQTASGKTYTHKWSFRRRRAWYYSSSDERHFSFIRKSEKREYFLRCSYL